MYLYLDYFGKFGQQNELSKAEIMVPFEGYDNNKYVVLVIPTQNTILSYWHSLHHKLKVIVSQVTALL